MEARAGLRKQGKVEEAGKLTKSIQKALRKDRKAEAIRATGKELDIRDRWMGIRFLKNKFTPVVYEQTDRFGKYVRPALHAQATADYLSHVQWGEGLRRLWHLFKNGQVGGGGLISMIQIMNLGTSLWRKSLVSQRLERPQVQTQCVWHSSRFWMQRI